RQHYRKKNNIPVLMPTIAVTAKGSLKLNMQQLEQTIESVICPLCCGNRVRTKPKVTGDDTDDEQCELCGGDGEVPRHIRCVCGRTARFSAGLTCGRLSCREDAANNAAHNFRPAL